MQYIKERQICIRISPISLLPLNVSPACSTLSIPPAHLRRGPAEIQARPVLVCTAFLVLSHLKNTFLYGKMSQFGIEVKSVGSGSDLLGSNPSSATYKLRNLTKLT